MEENATRIHFSSPAFITYKGVVKRYGTVDQIILDTPATRSSKRNDLGVRLKKPDVKSTKKLALCP